MAGAVTVAGAATFTGDVIPKGNVRNISFQSGDDTNINAQVQYDQVNANSGQLLFKTANAGTLFTNLTISNTGAATFSGALGGTSASFSGNIALGTTPASAAAGAVIRLPFDNAIRWRNSSNTADIGLYVGAGNLFKFDSGATFSSSVTAVNGVYTGTGEVIANTASGTLSKYIRLSNNSGHFYCGVEGATLDRIITGATAYDASIRGYSGLSFSANGGSSVQMRISSTGLTQINSTNTTALELITNQSASSLRLKNTGSIVADWIMQSGGITAGDLSFYNLDTSAYRLTISSGGNVGIGTNNPTGLAGKSLVVSSGIGEYAQIIVERTNAGNTGKYGMLVGNDGTFLLRNYITGGNDITMSSGGDVGIGLASDGATLHINGDLKTRLDSTYYMGLHNRYISTYVSSTQLGRIGSTSVSNTELRYDIAGAEIFEIRRNYLASKVIFTRNTTGTIAGPYTTDLTIDNTGTTTATRSDAGTLIQASSSSGAGSGLINFLSSMPSSANNTNCYHFSGTTQSVNSWRLYGNGSSSWTSDSRLKRDIETTRDGYLDDIKQLRVVKYKWKNDSNSSLELGLIAQEVETIFPSLVVEDKNSVGDEVLYNEDDKIPNGKKVGDVKIEGTTYKSVKYSVLPMILLKSIQEQQTIIESQKSLIDGLTARIETLEG